MARTNDFPRVLWLVTHAWLVGCGRVGFGANGDEPAPPLADAPPGVGVDAARPAADAPPPPDALPPIDASIPAGTPGIAFVIPTITTTCGAGTSSVTAVVSNPGTADLVITKITAMGGDAFQVTGAFPMTIAPAASGTFEITALAAIIGTDRGGQIKTDTLVIEANATTSPVTIHTTIMGANLAVTTPSPPTLGFSDLSGGCPPAQPATVQNTGNVTASVVVRVPARFAMAGATSASIAPGGGVLTRTFRPFSSGDCFGSGMIQYEVSGPNCGTSSAIAATVNAVFNISGASTCFCS